MVRTIERSTPGASMIPMPFSCCRPQKKNSSAVYSEGISIPRGVGNKVIIRTKFAFTITGEDLQSEVKGANIPIVGLLAMNSPKWYEGPRTAYHIVRRHNGFWGYRATKLDGWVGNQKLGFANDSGNAGSSGWNTMELVLIDNGVTYDAHFYVYDASGEVLLTAEPHPTKLESGSMIYAGYTNGWDMPTGETMASTAKVDEVKLDDLEIKWIPEVQHAGLLMGLSGLGFCLLRRRRQ